MPNGKDKEKAWPGLIIYSNTEEEIVHLGKNISPVVLQKKKNKEAMLEIGGDLLLILKQPWPYRFLHLYLVNLDTEELVLEVIVERKLVTVLNILTLSQENKEKHKTVRQLLCQQEQKAFTFIF